MKAVRNIFIIIYSVIIIFIGTLLISKNNYNIHKFGSINIINIDKNLSTKKYKEGSLVIIKKLKKEDLRKGQEIFVYNEKEKNILIKKNSFEVEYNDIIGIKILKINKLGNILIFMQSKWMAFILIISLCSFILVYEIKHLMSYSNIKIKKEKKDLSKTITIIESKPGIKKIDNLDEQVNELKFTTTSTNIFSEVIEDKKEKVDELIKELNKYKKEENKTIQNNNEKTNKNKIKQKNQKKKIKPNKRS